MARPLGGAAHSGSGGLGELSAVATPQCCPCRVVGVGSPELPEDPWHARGPFRCATGEVWEAIASPPWIRVLSHPSGTGLVDGDVRGRPLVRREGGLWARTDTRHVAASSAASWREGRRRRLKIHGDARPPLMCDRGGLGLMTAVKSPQLSVLGPPECGDYR